MAGIKRLIETGKLKTNRLRAATSTYSDYDEDFDALILLVVSPDTETVVHYLDDEPHIALLYEPESLEIVGVQIEDFVLSFIPWLKATNREWKLSEILGIELERDINLSIQGGRSKHASIVVSYPVGQADSSQSLHPAF
jgi:hypothetical protein